MIALSLEVSELETVAFRAAVADFIETRGALLEG